MTTAEAHGAAGPVDRRPGSHPVPSALDALAGGLSESVARFSFDVVTGTWWWSHRMFELHGLVAGEVAPSTDLLMAHKHPEDRVRTEGTLANVLASGEPFCCRHRIIDAGGRVHHVLSVGDAVLDEGGSVVSVHGYFIDLTSAMEQQAPPVALPLEMTPLGTSVEQAKGILVAAYRLSPDAALELLGWSAAQGRVNLPRLAQGLVREFAEAHSNSLSPAARAGAYLGLLPGPLD